LPEGEPIEAGMVTRSIESAQRKVEARNFDIRKQLLEYDDVANDQRKIIYQQRNELLEAMEISTTITHLRHGVVTDLVREYIPAESVEEQWDVPAAETALRDTLQLEIPLTQWLKEDDKLTDEDLLERAIQAADDVYAAKVALVGAEAFAGFERSVMLQSLDLHWREHLAALDMLREGIHLRSYAQKNPKQEYKRESFELFGQTLERVKHDVTRLLMTVKIQSQEQIEQAEERIEQAGERVLERAQLQHAEFDDLAEVAAGDAGRDDPALGQAGLAHKAEPVRREGPKLGRNDPCWCGSGKKYKQCHGKLS
jgi:preprotein translocase subunit SecA